MSSGYERYINKVIIIIIIIIIIKRIIHADPGGDRKVRYCSLF